MSVRSRTARVMTTLMRNDRDRRLGKPVKGHAILERMLLVGTRSADHIRASGHSGCIAMEVTPPCKNRPDTWLHPNASQKARFLLHRGRRPYMALRGHFGCRSERPLSGVTETQRYCPSRYSAAQFANTKNAYCFSVATLEANELANCLIFGSSHLSVGSATLATMHRRRFQSSFRQPKTI